MATEKLYDAVVTLGGTALPHVRSVTINYNAEMLDDTEMGDTTKSSTPGLFEWSIEVEALQEYGAAQVDAILWPLVGAAAFAIVVKPKSSAVSATNPSFTGNGVLEGYQPITGEVGQLQTVSATFQCAGTLVRATA